MDLTVIIPWRKSTEYRATLERFVLERHHKLLPDVPVVVGIPDEDGPFNRSQAINHGVAIAKTRYVAVADADTITNFPTIAAGYVALHGDAPWIIPYSTYYNLDQKSTEQILIEPEDQDLDPNKYTYEHIITHPPGPGHLSPVSGLFMIEREKFLDIGGFDEGYKGWGWEDRAWVLIADHQLGPHHRGEGFVCHLWHPIKEENAWGSPAFQENKRRYEELVRRNYQ